jgi:hypothetical protein
VVKAVDSKVRGSHRAGQKAVGLDVKLMDQPITRLPVMRLVCRAFDLQVLPQRAAAGDVHDLDAATNAEQRKIIGQRPFRKTQLDLIELWVDYEVAIVPRNRSVALWLDVCAAREEQSVDDLIQLPKSLRVSDDRDGQGNRACVLERLEVGTIESQLGRQAVAEKRAQGDTYDDRHL